MQISFAVKFLILSTLFCVSFPQLQALYFNFSNFDGQYSFFSLSESNIVKGAIQVTNDVRGPITDLSGRALYHKPFKLWKNGGTTISSFNTSFLLNILNQTYPSGEGLAFILTNNDSVPQNSSGEWLGILSPLMNGSSQANTVAIEFDTRKSFPQDLDDNHVGLDVNSINSLRQVSLTTLGVDISTGENFTVRVYYNGEAKNLSLFVNDMKNPVFWEILDLSKILPPEVFVGFSASTSKFTQLNCLLSWEFSADDIDDEALLWVWIVIPVVIVFLLFCIAFFIYWKIKSDRERAEDASPSIEEAIQGSSTAPRKFKLKELKKATGNFSPKNKLGKGGFGTVYKGMIIDKEVAVKKVSKKSTQGKTEFIAEVTTIGNLHHKNLVRLIGWCYEKKEFLLVYEYLQKGSLEKYIFSSEKSGEEESPESSLTWITRVKIITGAAHALDYLHNGCEEKVLHRDIKSSNIMLDNEFNAKLGDFGLARTIKLSDQTHHSTKEVAGTPGYMAPESILTGRFTVETDVYAFGITILEVACGRKPGSQNHQNDYSCNIVNWVWELHRNGRIIDAADSRLRGDFEIEEMEWILILGLACCHPNPNKRPNMKTVLQVLKKEALPPPVPNERPAFMWPPLPPSFKESEVSLGYLTPFSEINGR